MIRAGLYVHVPFCLTRCGYCDFNTYAGLEHLRSPYVAALRDEAVLASPDWTDVSFVSLFLGGGTPTILPADQVVALIDQLQDRFRFVAAPEVTAEANPDTVDEAYLIAIRSGGVTRLSLGVQSFDPKVLASLERVHGPAAARAAFAAARRAGFDHVNLDLIYGAEGETTASWGRTLREAVAMRPEHLSCYALTVEPATSLGRRVAAGLVPPPDPDLQADRYALACSMLGAAGYQHYEVSNWALPGHRCTHNLGYWEGRPYLGLGAGAHSYRDGRRWWNVRPPQQYVDLVGSGRAPVGGEERLCPEERQLERLLLGLRVAEGVPADWVDPETAGDFVMQGLAERRGERLALTDRGMLLANEVVLSLVGEPAAPTPWPERPTAAPVPLP